MEQIALSLLDFSFTFSLNLLHVIPDRLDKIDLHHLIEQSVNQWVAL